MITFKVTFKKINDKPTKQLFQERVESIQL